jgi:hypothetical protein
MVYEYSVVAFHVIYGGWRGGGEVFTYFGFLTKTELSCLLWTALLLRIVELCANNTFVS